MIRRPALAAALLLAGAVLLGDRWPAAAAWAQWAALALGLAALALLWAGRPRWAGLLALLGLALFGLGRSAHLAQPHPLAAPFDVSGRPLEATLQGLVLKDARGGNDPARLELLVERADLRGRELPGRGARALVSVYAGPVKAAVGDRVRLRARIKLPVSFANPGCFDLAAYQRRRGVVLLAGVSDSDRIELVQPAAGLPLRRGLERLRSRVRDLILTSAPGEAGAVLCALVLGETELIQPELRTAFNRSGAAHLLSISGTHVSALAAFVAALLLLVFKLHPAWALRIDVRKAAAAACLLPVAGYVLLADVPITALRAALMAAVAALALVSDRLRDLASCVALAATTVLLIWPGALWEPGAQLSFSAVLIMALYLGWARRRRARQSALDRLEQAQRPAPLLRWAAHLMGLSLALVLGTAPVTAAHFGQVTPGAVLANLAAVPLVGLLIVPLGLAGAVLGLVLPGPGGWLLTLAGSLIEGLLPFLRQVAELPGSYLTVPPPRLMQTALLLLAVLALGLERPRRASGRLALALVALAGLFELGLWARARLDDTLRVEALDVGQGLCLLVRLPHGRAVLIDGGGSRLGELDIGSAAVLPYLRHERIRTLEFVLATHPHPDHFLGLMPVLHNLRVKEFWRSRFNQHEQQADERYVELLELVRTMDIPERIIDSDTPAWRTGDVRIDFLSPPPPGVDLQGWTLNDKSVALKLTCDQVSFLLGADIEQRAERRLVESDLPLQASVILAPHHGSATSSSAALLQRVHPKHALISVGRFNPYGLPNPKVTERYERSGVQIWRTDFNGLISLRTDGRGLEISTALSPVRGPTSADIAPAQ